MKLANWTPFSHTDEIFNRLRGEFFRPSGLKLLGSDFEWQPTADISETKKEYLIKLDLPEVDKEDVDVSVTDGVLTIKGERRLEKESDDEQQHRIESFYGTFSRSFTLPDNIELDAIKATNRRGVLKIHLPKSKESKPESVEIQVQ
jgi:HSP20 family protein